MSKMKAMIPMLAAFAAMGNMEGFSSPEKEKYGIGMGTVKKWKPSNSGLQSTLTPKQKKARSMSKIQKRSRKINRK